MSSNLIIAIVSGLITLIVSVLVTSLKNKSELKKIKKELELNYAKSLFDKRIEVYPSLFCLLSGLNKLIEYNRQSKADIIEFQKNIDKWNNENAIFLTTTSSRIAYGYRYYLIDLTSKYSDKEIPENDWKNIRKINVTFEKSLRAEIGVYDTL